MTAIVTGSSGFIGTALVRRLVSDGWNVVGIDRRIPDECCSYEFRWAGLSVPPFLGAATCDVVFHLAATPGVMTSVSDPVGVYANNVSSTANALEMAKRYGAKRFVFASSSTVYGNAAADSGKPVDELTPLEPLNAYAASKIACENAVRDMARFADIDYAILRLFSVYGPGMRGDLAMPKIARCAMDEADFPMRGDGSSRRDYTYIDDVVDAFVRAAVEPKAKNKTFNVCGGSPVSLLDAIAAVGEALGAKVSGRECGESPYDARDTFGSNVEALNCLGWSPKTDFREGVKRFSEWFKEKEKKS